MDSKFNIGEYVIMRGNCDYNRNVETGKETLLCYGPYSCDPKEIGTELVVIMEPKRTLVTTKQYINGRFQTVQEYHDMVRVISTKTKNCYNIDTAWADSYPKDEYESKLDDALSMAAFDSILDDMMEDYLDTYEYDDYFV